MTVRAGFFTHEDSRSIAVRRWMIEATKDDDGDANYPAALMLAQITWWTQPDERTGKVRAGHDHGGNTWLVRPDDGWVSELGMGRKAARKARLRLESLGLIEAVTLVDGGVRCTHLRRLPTAAHEAAEPSTIVPEGEDESSRSGTVREPVQALTRVRASSSSLDLEVGGEKEPLSANADAQRLCDLLADLVASDGSKRPVVTLRWLTECERLIRLDGHTPEQVERAIRWCQADPFWQANILSMPTLRAKYDQLRKAAKRAGNAAPAASRADVSSAWDRNAPSRTLTEADL